MTRGVNFAFSELVWRPNCSLAISHDMISTASIVRQLNRPCYWYNHIILVLIQITSVNTNRLLETVCWQRTVAFSLAIVTSDVAHVGLQQLKEMTPRRWRCLNSTRREREIRPALHLCKYIMKCMFYSVYRKKKIYEFTLQITCNPLQCAERALKFEIWKPCQYCHWLREDFVKLIRGISNYCTRLMFGFTWSITYSQGYHI